MSRHTEPNYAIGTHANGTPFSVRLPPGKYLVEVEGMDYHGISVDATLRLRMTRQMIAGSSAANNVRRHALRGRTAGEVQEAYTFNVPLTSCGPSNLVLLDLDVVKKRVWKPLPGRTQLPATSAIDTALDLDSELGIDDDVPPAKRQRVVISPREETSMGTPVEPYAADWQIVAAQPQVYGRGSSVAPYVAKKETNTGSPSLSEIIGPDEDAEFTFELEGPDSSEEDDDAQSTGTVDSQVPDHPDDRIDYAAFPISTGAQKQAGERLHLGLPTLDA